MGSGCRSILDLDLGLGELNFNLDSNSELILIYILAGYNLFHVVVEENYDFMSPDLGVVHVIMTPV